MNKRSIIDKKISNIVKEKEKKYNNIFRRIMNGSLSKHTFLLYWQNYKNFIKQEIDNLVWVEQQKNKDNNKKTNIDVAIGVRNKNLLVSLVQQQTDNDIYEVVGKWMYELFIWVIENYIVQIITNQSNIKKLNNLIREDIEEQISSKKNLSEIEQKELKWIVSNSFLINNLTTNLYNIITWQKELVTLDFTQKIKKKLQNSILNKLKWIEDISWIMYKNIIKLLKDNNITFNILYEDFEIILNSLEFNQQRELSIFNTFQIFNQYLSNINTEIFDYNNFYIINDNTFISRNSLLRLEDNINFSIMEMIIKEKDIELFIIENLLHLYESQKKHIENNYKSNIKLRELKTIFTKNIKEIITYINFLYQDTDQNIIWTLLKYFEKDINNIHKETDIWKIDNFINFTNQLFSLNKIRIKVNKKNYFINKIINNNFTVFKKNYFINKEVKKDIDEILWNIYKKIYIKEIFNNSNGTVSNVLLLWPTWSWKSFFAKSLSKEIWSSLVKIDANFLKSDHSFTNIVWSPPSYVWFDSLNDWQEKVKEINEQWKNGVLLIDEVEKADTNILDLFLWILDEGEIILSNGTKLDLSKFIVIFTSNLIQEEKDNTGIWFNFQTPQEQEEKDEQISQKYNNIKDDLLEFFKPEFLWRIDQIKMIPSYTKQNLDTIFDFISKQELDKYDISTITQKKIKKELNNRKNNIINKVFETKENIRLLKKEIETIIFNNIVIW